MVEFSLKGTVVKAYLLGNSNGYAYNVTVKLDDDEIEKIKAVVSKAPNCKNTGQYRWPFTGVNAKFTLKDDVNSKFKFVWRVEDENQAREIDVRKPAPQEVEKIKQGCNVYIEYIPVSYSGREATKPKNQEDGVMETWTSGCTLRLVSIGLSGSSTEDVYDFESAKKKRRMGNASK